MEPTQSVTNAPVLLQRRALAALCGVLFLTFLDTTIVAVALGSVQADLQVGVVSLQWVVSAYALVFVSLMLPAGTIADRWGRKRVMLVGLALFCGASVLGAVAPNVALLIAARAIMGVGAACCEPQTLSVIRHLYPNQRTRSRALGVWAAVSGLALAAGPILGGALVGIGSWRTVFWFNLVLGIVLFAAAARFVPESADPQAADLDLPGFALAAIGLGCGIFAGIAGEDAGYQTPWIIGLFVISGAALVGFVIVEQRSRAPMLDLRYVREPAVSGPLLVAFATYFGIFAIFFFTALYLQEVVGYSGFRTAAQFAPMTVAMIVGSLLAGRWVARVGPRIPMTVGSMLAAAGILLTEHYLTAEGNFGPLAAALAVAGIGFGVAVVPLTSAVLSAIPAAQSGMAASATNTSRQLGAVVGVVALGSLVNAHLTSDLTNRLEALGIPANFQSIVIAAIKDGTVPSGGKSAATAAYGPIVNQVLDAAYSAFRAGLTSALTVSALMIFVAGLIAAVTIRPRSRASGGGVEGGEPDQSARGSANRSRWRIASRARQP
jgi:EmrB/QacA subfamily drug resistance transporter